MSDPGLRRVANQLATKLEQDSLVHHTVTQLRNQLQVDRVVLYYFYCEWEGQVTFESVASRRFSILGETGPDECFNNEYAARYLAGRVRAIPNIETEVINPCHKDFLRNLKVRANLAVPVITQNRLWGLLIAHHCQSPHTWTEADVEKMREAAQKLSHSLQTSDFGE